MRFTYPYANGFLCARKLAQQLSLYKGQRFNVMSKKNVKPKQKAPTKSHRIMVRLTEEEYDRVLFDAELSGLTVCAYARKRLNGDHPKRRMTEDEIAALGSFSDARGDIVRLFSFLKSKPYDERERIMRTQVFSTKWRDAANKVLNRMVEIEKNISQ